MENLTSNTQYTNAVKPENNRQFGDMSENVLSYERKAIENTPFILHRSDSEGWSLGIAEHRLTGWYQTEEEINKILTGLIGNSINWDMLTGVILILIEKVLEAKKVEEAANNK